MEHFLDRISLEGTRFEKLNSEIDFLGKDGKPLHLVVLAGVNGSGKTNLLNEIHSYRRKIGNPSYHFNYFSLDKRIFKKYVDKVIYEDGLTVKNAIDDINSKIFSLIPDFKVKIDRFSVNPNNDHFEVHFKNEFGDKFSSTNSNVGNLSSGESTLLGSIFRLYLEKLSDIIILIDEPEDSLHPSWQSKVVQLYENYAKQNNCQIIMATHSPFILSAVKSEQIRLLKRTPEGIKIEKIEEEINGWTIERILQYFMETEHVRDPKTDKEIAELFEMMKSGNFNNDSFKERFAVLEQRLGYADRLSYTDKDMVSLRMELNRLQKNENN